MSERKLKCARCGKWFKAADYKRLLCPACTLAEKQKRQQVASAPVRPAALTASVNGRPVAVAVVARPEAEHAAPPAPRAKEAAPEHPAPAPRQLTDAERADVERRYLELAAPQEFDGIRAQVAAELGLPKALVKAAINALRQRRGLPSWWEIQQGELPSALVEMVRAQYAPLLPLPPVGVHRVIAEELHLTTLQVYRAIGLIRKEMGLPKFNERDDLPARPEAEAEATSAPSA